MAATKLIALVVGLALTRVQASPAAYSDVTTTPAATPSSCLSPDAWCGVESTWYNGYFGRRRGLTNVHQCYDFCNLPRRWGDCKSFTYSEEGTCWIHDYLAKDGTKEDPGSDSYVWDKECWTCGVNVPPSPTTSSPAATSTCLSPTALCEVEAVWRGGSDLAPWGTGDGVTYPYGCWEGCVDARRPDRCKSFTWEPSTETCTFYEHSANASHYVEAGSGVWLWDIACWTCGVSGYM
ncbi:hypothetical protein B0T10DRAFT_489257 [Thelonectria olida]|uniref:Apple domain-containing protein n=1 Tax=Thelonectria olida TaxID=1576542 RepID=A0A9P9ANF5_9HYPO|nr:hypothetical protein B0T10DRAFT_489257 [Thelonectria olida]